MTPVAVSHLAIVLLIEQGMRLLRYRGTRHNNFEHLTILAALFSQVFNDLKSKHKHSVDAIHV